MIYKSMRLMIIQKKVFDEQMNDDRIQNKYLYLIIKTEMQDIMKKVNNNGL